MGGAARSAGLAVLVALAAAAPASAAKVTTRTVCEGYGKGCSDVTYVTYTAAPGEQNDLVASYRNGRVTFSDRVPISAPRACQRESPTKVSCPGTVNHADLGDGDDIGTATNHPTPYGGGVSIDGGDGNDSLAGHGASVSGGAGDDWLTGNSISGGDGNDLLIGTDGNDYLSGNAGADELHGGAGNDYLNGDGGAAGNEIATDLIDGGPGEDAVSYASRLSPVEVDIGAQVGGGPGEHDVLESIEDATGGAGADRLVGDDAPNVLQGGYDCPYDMLGGPGDDIRGGGGDDVLRAGCNSSKLYGEAGNDYLGGGGSADTLDGGPGNDTLGGDFGADDYSGGPGNDAIYPNGGDAGATISCGDGADVVDDSGLSLLQPDCETARRVYTRAAAYPARPTTSVLRFTVRCRVHGRACKARVRLKVRGRRNAFAIGIFSARNGVLHPHFRLPARIAGMQRSPLPIRVIVEGVQRQQGSDDFDIQWVFDLSATPVAGSAVT